MRKNISYLILILATIPSLVVGQTTITGGAVKGKWTKTNSPYKITGSIRSSIYEKL